MGTMAAALICVNDNRTGEKQVMMGFRCAPWVAVKYCASLLLCLLMCAPSLAEGVAGSAVEKAAPAPDPYRIVAYVAGWSTPAVIHPEKLTHINFAFARITAAGQAALADGGLEASLLRLIALKKTNSRLKVIVSIGGWMAEGFSDAALTDASRALFADSAVELLRRFSADGIDIDWEYPGQGVAGIKYRAEDRENFTRLLKTLRDKLDEASAAQGRTGGSRYTLTIASADREYFDHAEMDKLHRYLDWINVMSYDFFNSLTPTTGHHAGLYKAALALPTDRDADASVKQHLAAGIPADKIVLGVAFYGRGFTGVRPVDNGLKQPYERFEGAHDYSELADKFIGRQGFVRYWDDRAKAPYLWNSTTKTFITYDDPQSIKIKAQYIKAHHLGGMMFWELSEDRNDELLDVIARSMR
jgi:chitinase